MTLVLLLIFWLIGGVLFFFAGYQFIFVLISAIYWLLPKKPDTDIVNRKNKFGIIIPAHNEETLIGGLVESIQKSDYPKDHVHIYVIADNCDDKDKTVDIARSLGADVRERIDTEKRGKPYALNWLISSINLDEYDAYIIIDADTTVDKAFLTEMDKALKGGNEVIQGYFGVMNPDENWLTRLSILPGVLKFLLHFPGKKLFNLSCPLAGNGMCFSNTIFKKYGWNAFSVAENWEYYIQLTLNEHRVTSAEKAIIYSQVTNTLKSGKDQRQRWQRGRMDTLSKYWKLLIKKTFTDFDFSQLDALIEVLRPSHAMLIFWSVFFVLITAISYIFNDVFLNVFVFASVILSLQIIYFLSGLVVQRAPLKTWLSLFMVPPYLFWKVIISLSALKDRKDKSWIKTERH